MEATHGRIAILGGGIMGSGVAAIFSRGGWDVHVGILEDVLTNRAPRGFWSSHEKREQEYSGRFAE